MAQREIPPLSYQDLACYTDNFSESNYLCHFQFGKLYRGKIGERYVMVKIWEVSEKYYYKPGDYEFRLMDEVCLLGHRKMINHPGMLKLLGYCYEDDLLGIVYDFKPFDTVYNLILEDGLTWLQRIKVLVGLASILSSLHTVKSPPYKPFIFRNLDCAHIVLDEDYNPKLCDFGLVSGGIFPDRTIYTCHHVIGSYGYIDITSFDEGCSSAKQDVYAFGVILLSMISKRVYTEEDRLSYAPNVFRWAWGRCFEYDREKDSDSKKHDSDTGDSKKPKFSVVHPSLVAEDPDFDPSDGYKITSLGLDCTGRNLSERPTMKQVFRSLLKVVKNHTDFIGANNDALLLRPCEK
ncbi:hypothetical protein ABFX02_14G180200 [Erythranthe guttata]